MGEKLLLMNSVTSAQKGRDILKENKIKAFIERTPKNKVNGSCGYSIYVPFNMELAKTILEGKGLKILGVVPRNSE